MKVVVHVDGGARGNPGPAAAAAVISTPDGEEIGDAAERIGAATNNVAEYRALLLGLRRARELGATEVEVVNDSELIAKQVTGSYRVKNADLKPLHAQALEALRGFERWSIRSVPRAENAGADALVNQALDADPEGIAVAPVQTETAPASHERAGGTDYATYLLIDDLLDLQRPLTPDAHDELLFIVVHQSYELWFKLILHELTRARDELLARRPHAAAPRLAPRGGDRAAAARPPRRARDDEPGGVPRVPRPARARVGLPVGPVPPHRVDLGPARHVPGRRVATEGPDLYAAFRVAADLPEDEQERIRALADLYRDHEDDPERAWLHDVAERLVDHDEGVSLWRRHHVLMAAREIGSRAGTGGSPGVPYLETTLSRRFFPELWDVRVAL